MGSTTGHIGCAVLAESDMFFSGNKGVLYCTVQYCRERREEEHVKMFSFSCCILLYRETNESMPNSGKEDETRKKEADFPQKRYMTESKSHRNGR